MQTSKRCTETIESIKLFIESQTGVNEGFLKNSMMDGNMINSNERLQEMLKNPQKVEERYTVYKAIFPDRNSKSEFK